MGNTAIVRGHVTAVVFIAANGAHILVLLGPDCIAVLAVGVPTRDIQQLG